MAERPTVVDLVAAVVTSEATRPRGDKASPYSWGTTLQLTPGYARDTAVAVVEALRRAGQLNSAARLTWFGHLGWAFGWLAGALGELAVDWSPWSGWIGIGVGVGLGVASFTPGVLAIGWAARRAAGRVER